MLVSDTAKNTEQNKSLHKQIHQKSEQMFQHSILLTISMCAFILLLSILLTKDYPSLVKIANLAEELNYIFLLIVISD